MLSGMRPTLPRTTGAATATLTRTGRLGRLDREGLRPLVVPEALEHPLALVGRNPLVALCPASEDQKEDRPEGHVHPPYQPGHRVDLVQGVPCDRRVDLHR
jgi:hypothetical protein